MKNLKALSVTLTSEPMLLTVLCRTGLVTASFPCTGLVATGPGTTFTT